MMLEGRYDELWKDLIRPEEARVWLAAIETEVFLSRLI
jgi:hypothetical protein